MKSIYNSGDLQQSIHQHCKRPSVAHFIQPKDIKVPIKDRLIAFNGSGELVTKQEKQQQQQQQHLKGFKNIRIHDHHFDLLVFVFGVYWYDVAWIPVQRQTGTSTKNKSNKNKYLPNTWAALSIALYDLGFLGTGTAERSDARVMSWTVRKSPTMYPTLSLPDCSINREDGGSTDRDIKESKDDWRKCFESWLLLKRMEVGWLW